MKHKLNPVIGIMQDTDDISHLHCYALIKSNLSATTLLATKKSEDARFRSKISARDSVIFVLIYFLVLVLVFRLFLVLVSF